MSQSARRPHERHAFRSSHQASAYSHAHAAPDVAGRTSPPAREEGPRQPGVPFWMPKKEMLHAMSPKFRQAVAELIDPAYQDLVIAADTPMAKNLGASVVYLLWLELLEQFDFKPEDSNTELCRITGTDRSESLNRYLKLLNAKLRVSQFLLRLRELRLKEAHGQPAAPSPPAITPAADPAEPHSWINQKTLSKSETETQDPRPKAEDPTWKNQETLTKTETENQDRKPKPQDPSGSFEETLSKTEMAETTPSHTPQRNPYANLLSHPVSDAERASLRKAFQQAGIWKNQETLSKTEPANNQDPNPKPKAPIRA